MAIDTTAFERLGIHIQPAEVQRWIATAIDQMLLAHRVTEPGRELPANEARALLQAGMGLGNVNRGANDPLVRSLPSMPR